MLWCLLTFSANSYHGDQTLSHHIVSMSIGILALTLSMYLSFRQIISIRLDMLTHAQQCLIKGEKDLTANLEVKGNDEISTLIEAHNALLAMLDTTLIGIKTSAVRLRPMSRELLDSKTNLTQMNQLQYDQCQHISTAMSEITTCSGTMTGHIDEIVSISQSSEKVISQGEQMITKTFVSIQELAHEIEQAMTPVAKLQEASKQISFIIEIINNIAEQTNLLALNAAIEAARAGEAGRGFAVVADEVRSLSLKTQQSTTEVGKMVALIQTTAQNVVDTIHHSKQTANTNVEYMQASKHHFNQIQGNIHQISRKTSQISTTINDQNKVLDKLKQANRQIYQLSEEIIEVSNHSSLAWEDLIQLSKYLIGHTKGYLLSQNKFDVSRRPQKNQNEKTGTKDDSVDQNGETTLF